MTEIINKTRRTKVFKTYPLGSKQISLTSLNKNKLSIFNKSNNSILKKELITDDLKEIIRSILREDYDLEEEISILSDKEQELLHDLLELCKIDNVFQIHKYHKSKRDIQKNKLITKFNVMKDEILIGNDNPELLKEFGELLDVLLENRMLTKTEYKNLKELLVN